MKKGLFATAAAGALFVGLGTAPASADAITQFTWNPSAASPALSNAPAFTANNFVVDDYSNIVLNANGTATETGYLPIDSFKLNPSGTVSTPGLNGTSGATAYELYFQFTSTSHLVGWNPAVPNGAYLGAFDTLTYTMFGDAGGNCQFSVVANTPTAACGADSIVTLASGVLTPGFQPNSVTLISGVPGASATESFVENPGQLPFFMAPVNMTLDLINVFTNTNGVTTISSCSTAINPNCTDIAVAGGGGNANLVAVSVPEPATVGLFGLGLLGLGWFTRRRNRNA